MENYIEELESALIDLLVDKKPKEIQQFSNLEKERCEEIYFLNKKVTHRYHKRHTLND